MRRRRGFTLLELLVSVTLGAALVALTAHVFGTAVRGRERLERTAGDLAALRRAYETITRDMHSATVPPDDSGWQFGLSATGAGAGSDILQFASLVGEPLLLGRAGNETALIQYAVAEDPETGRSTLWRYETAYPVPDGAAAGGGAALSQDTRAIPLLPGVTGAAYLFYSEEQQSWLQTWENQAGLPSAIRLDLTLQAGDTEEQDGEAGSERLESWVFSLPAAAPPAAAGAAGTEEEL